MPQCLRRPRRSRSAPLAACLLAALLCLACLAGTARAHTVLLDNGDRLSGEILRLRDGFLHLETDYAGVVKLEWDRVLRVDTLEPLAVWTDTGRVEAMGLEKSGRDVRLRTHGGRAVDADRVVAVGESPGGWRKEGRAEAGWSSNSGNSNSQALRLDATGTARKGPHRLKGRAEYDYAQEEDELYEREWRVEFSYDHFLDEHVFVSMSTVQERDVFQDLNLRSAYGAALGYQFLETQRTSLAAELGLSYVLEDVRGDGGEQYLSVRWALDASRWLWKERLQGFHSHRLYQSLRQDDNVTLETETGLRLFVRDDIYLSLKYEWDWRSDPPEDAVAVDRRVQTSVGVRW
jgi:putative salt-induced outer membrane protein YdiY